MQGGSGVGELVPPTDVPGDERFLSGIVEHVAHSQEREKQS